MFIGDMFVTINFHHLVNEIFAHVLTIMHIASILCFVYNFYAYLAYLCLS